MFSRQRRPTTSLNACIFFSSSRVSMTQSSSASRSFRLVSPPILQSDRRLQSPHYSLFTWHSLLLHRCVQQKPRRYSHGVGLSGFLNEGREELGLADCAIVILVHGLEIRLECGLIELSVWFDTKEHAAAELPHLTLFKLPVTINVDAGE